LGSIMRYFTPLRGAAIHEATFSLHSR
jgi:hypothetical protein